MADWKSALSALSGLNEVESPKQDIVKEQKNTIVSKGKREGVVYSTNKDYEYCEDVIEEPETLPKQHQKLRLNIEKTGRSGKTVTIIKGFIGTEDDLKALCKTLKQKCGVGGSVKDNEIIIQGELRAKLTELLKKEGYSQTK